VCSGLAEVVVASETQEIGISYRKPHEFFGETVFLSEKTYPASVKAAEELHCYLLDKETFEDLCVKYPSFAKFFSQILSERMRSIYKELILTQPYELSGIEPNPFRRRLSELMTGGITTCADTASVGEVADLMTKNSISSVVVLKQKKRLAGLITEKDLVAKCISSKLPPAKWPLAKDVMNTSPVQLPPNTTFYEALLTMVKNKCKHLLVVEEGKLLGIVTIGDLIKYRSMGAFSVVEDIETQSNIEGLAVLRQHVNNVLKAMVSEKAPPIEICEVITEYNDRITCRAIEICEQEMLKEGYGLPPVDYCWITMGNSGRKEQLLTSDQNNGIIFDNVPEENLEEVTQYFLKLGGKVVDGLEKCGISKCPERNMANNPLWCQPISMWYQKIAGWVDRLQPQDIHYLTAFSDFRPIYGAKGFGDNLKSYVMDNLCFSQRAFKALALEELKYDVPIKAFRKTITEPTRIHENEINLKTQACMHVVNCVRIFSMKESIPETATLKRLELLAKRGVIPKQDAEYIEAAYQSLLMFRLKTNLEKLKEGKEPDNFINPNQLTKMQYLALKEALIAVGQLQNYTKAVFVNP